MSLRVAGPLADITNFRALQSNKLAESPDARASCSSFQGLSPEMWSPSPEPMLSSKRFSHDPYNWKCLPDEGEVAMIMAQRLAAAEVQRKRFTVTTAPAPAEPTPAHQTPAPVPAVAPATACRALVQFKCHQTEFSSPIGVDKGQYVVVEGDRGIDIGVVIRVNTDGNKSYVERTGPSGSIIRHATQREVDYWATDLKADEAAALEYCQERVSKQRLPMEVKHAEYQFDKKKLTFYYEAKARVDFVTMLKELYREFGCRIWMEKVRLNQME